MHLGKFDLTLNKKFLAVPYGCAALGAVTGMALTATTTLPGIIVAGICSAAFFGVGLPVLASGAIGTVIAMRSSEKMKALELTGIGSLIIGANCVHALFLQPFQAIAQAFKKSPPKEEASIPHNTMKKFEGLTKIMALGRSFKVEAAPPANTLQNQHRTTKKVPEIK